MSYLAIALKPFIALVFLAVVCIPTRIIAKRYLPEGKVKRFLLREI
jgi:hypothetical protein